MKDETGTQYRMRKAEEAEKARLLGSRDKISEYNRIKKGYLQSHNQVEKINNQILKIERMG